MHFSWKTRDQHKTYAIDTPLRFVNVLRDISDTVASSFNRLLWQPVKNAPQANNLNFINI